MNPREGDAVEFMLLFTGREGMSASEAGLKSAMAEMTAFAVALAKEGKLRRGGALGKPSDAAWTRVRDGKALVTDGPFAESKEVLGGFWVVDVASRAEAIEIARRSPHARWGNVQVHALKGRYTFPDSGQGAAYLLAFRMEPGLTPDAEKGREMMAFGEGLVSAGKLYETAPLADEPPPARIEPRGGQTLVTDGPFAEAKEAVGGYGLVRVADRAEAIDIAKRFPHARWGPVEVREIVYVDEV
jgi:hypothetical protein